MFDVLGRFVARRWLLVILAWVLLVGGVRAIAPRWEDVTYDGDFAYLPADKPSVVGERLLAEAFPYNRTKSQFVVVTAREGAALSSDDIYVACDVARRFRNLLGAAAIQQAGQLAAQAKAARERGEAETAAGLDARSKTELEAARIALLEALRLDRTIVNHRQRRQESADGEVQLDEHQLARSYHNLALLEDHLGNPQEAAANREIAWDINPVLKKFAGQVVPDWAGDLPLVDVWTWHDDVVGEKLISRNKSARLIILHLSNEFMATDNIRVLERIESVLDDVRGGLDQHTQPGLTVGFSGSAAVGGDMLRAAKESIEYTELFTVVLVISILALVYRSPLLVAVPLATIVVSLTVATGAVALLTQVGYLPGFDWWGFKVFTTTKIFIVVILFGAGTDFCLFLISRYKEELQAGSPPETAVARALSGVGDALAASALTTIVGLSMMFFSDFGKFRYSGPAIAFCLSIALLACVTLTPALLRLLGQAVFWPFGIVTADSQSGAKKGVAKKGTGVFCAEHPAGRSGKRPPSPVSLTGAAWHWVARGIVAYPGLILVVSVVLLLPLAGYGWHSRDHVTYDFLNALSADRPSKQGAYLLAEHFTKGESGPLTILARKQGADFLTDEGRKQIRQLANELYIDGVLAVRCLTDPLGEFPPWKKVPLFRRRSWRTRLMQGHERTEGFFVSQDPPLAGAVTHFDLILEHDPFSAPATGVLNQIDAKLQALGEQEDSFWYGSHFSYVGTTAAIRDLHDVTQADNRRIMVLVVVAVSIVLLLILRRPVICLYMIASVLLSYYVTIGATELFFGWVYGDTFQGLDWKVPLFLFVVLVAVGQDYNVYLATRVFEEQSRLGPFCGLRRAIVRTGGIITSCGVIMAGTFISMTSGTWGEAVPSSLPGLAGLLANGGVLRSIVELGFALALGVMLDTFVVRPVLVPAFLALLCRWKACRSVAIS